MIGKRKKLIIFVLYLSFVFCDIFAYSGKIILRSGEEFKGKILIVNSEIFIFCKNELKKIDYSEVMDLIVYDFVSSDKEKNKKHKIPEKYVDIIHKASQKYNIEPEIIASVISAESDFDNLCISDKGACGLMQLMPDTSRRLKVKNVYNPEENIMGGTLYLKYMLETFKGNLDLSLAGYNAGPNAVKKYKGIPPYKETANYIKKVKSNLKKYKGSKPIVKTFKDGKFILTNE